MYAVKKKYSWYKIPTQTPLTHTHIRQKTCMFTEKLFKILLYYTHHTKYIYAVLFTNAFITFCLHTTGAYKMLLCLCECGTRCRHRLNPIVIFHLRKYKNHFLSIFFTSPPFNKTNDYFSYNKYFLLKYC